jgi:hypothetical protein
MATAVRTNAAKTPAQCGCAAPRQAERATPSSRAPSVPLPAFEFGSIKVDAPRLPDAVMKAAAGWLPEPQSERRRPPRQDDTAQDQTDQTEDDGAVPPDQCACASQDDNEQTSRAMERRVPTENGAAVQRPQEAGWFTGDWYKTQNTIICDGSGSLGINESTNYQYGVQDCTRQHEGSHRTDWYARYGNDICKGRAKGDLPHFDPPGKDAYATFLNKSECSAWKVGETCRDAALAACADDACKTYVQPYVTQAKQMVKKYC